MRRPTKTWLVQATASRTPVERPQKGGVNSLKRRPQSKGCLSGKRCGCAQVPRNPKTISAIKAPQTLIPKPPLVQLTTPRVQLTPPIHSTWRRLHPAVEIQTSPIAHNMSHTLSKETRLGELKLQLARTK
ncbi:hypothetical protein K438DRAFT_451360 [Mycena galopus ATCC 62051]|nr:hypothetical protein K438DRAFT_451360 [Mycena galopus ATCC 62051]